MSHDEAFPFQDRPYPEQAFLTALGVLTAFGVPWLALISLARLALRLLA